MQPVQCDNFYFQVENPSLGFSKYGVQVVLSCFPIISHLLQKCFYGGQSGCDDPAEAVVGVGHVRVR